MAMEKPEPVLVADLFPEILDSLLTLLRGLGPAEWERATSAAGWTVKDVGVHLLGDDIGILSRRRDGYREPSPSLETWDQLVVWLNARNEEWVRVNRRISPPLLCDLLQLTGEQACSFFRSLDPFALGGAVSWAGGNPAPVWLDVAREFTERWHHQQHIRDAVGRPGLMEPRYLGPVLAAFVRALPRTFAQLDTPQGTRVTLAVIGPAGGSWTVVRESEGWILYRGTPPEPDAAVDLPEDAAWRLFTKGLSPEQARSRAVLYGDQALAGELLKTISIIA
ncbi:MAG: maleylpyruvate isomerase family mycothiol-dependent enzyme [Rudaea sp.]